MWFDDTSGDSDAPPLRTLKAAEVCGVCPVRVACRAEAVRDELVGVWGGQWRHRRRGAAFGRIHVTDLLDHADPAGWAA